MEVVQTRYGQLIASRNDVYVGRGLFEYGEFSEGEVELFRKLIGPDDVVVDVGANIGAHTLAFARLAKHVYAFEPQPLLYQALCGMVALNELANVTTAHAGCSSREGTMSLADMDFSRPNNFGAAALQPYCGARAIRVTKLTIDCQFLKIDVEGMELDVLRGAAEMIQRCKPVMYIEADRPDKFDALTAFIRYLGYVPYWHTPMLFNPDNFKGVARNVWGADVASFNLLCTPDRLEGFQEATEFPRGFVIQDFREAVNELGSASAAGV
jgi:FkbM family methyltransferase